MPGARTVTKHFVRLLDFVELGDSVRPGVRRRVLLPDQHARDASATPPTLPRHLPPSLPVQAPHLSGWYSSARRRKARLMSSADAVRGTPSAE